MNRVFAVLLGCGLALASLAAAPPAQKPAAVPAKPAAAPPQLPAMFAADDPAKVKAAREFIILYHPQVDPARVKKQLDNYIPRAIAMNKKNKKDFDAKKYETDLRKRVMDGTYKKLDLQSHIVSRHFTLDELKALIGFFKGPLGKKLVAETSKIQHDMLMIRRTIGQTIKGSSYYGDDKDDEDEDDDAPVKKPAPKLPVLKPQPKK